eukprot:Skav230841  [mRNA]  locus=scaffold3471:104556:112242:+ [translate_table: standard]
MLPPLAGYVAIGGLLSSAISGRSALQVAFTQATRCGAQRYGRAKGGHPAPWSSLRVAQAPIPRKSCEPKLKAELREAKQLRKWESKTCCFMKGNILNTANLEGAGIRTALKNRFEVFSKDSNLPDAALGDSDCVELCGAVEQASPTALP